MRSKRDSQEAETQALQRCSKLLKIFLTYTRRPSVVSPCFVTRKKNGFVTAAKLGTTKFFFVAATKNFAAATKRFVDRTKHFVVVTKYFCYSYFNERFCWYNKTFYTVHSPY